VDRDAIDDRREHWRSAWRGLSLDFARTFFTMDEDRRVIDLLALYKLNVLHLHLDCGRRKSRL
jgi:N-acetyl-beta-hexosaminidase